MWTVTKANMVYVYRIRSSGGKNVFIILKLVFGEVSNLIMVKSYIPNEGVPCSPALSLVQLCSPNKTPCGSAAARRRSPPPCARRTIPKGQLRAREVGSESEARRLALVWGCFLAFFFSSRGSRRGVADSIPSRFAVKQRRQPLKYPGPIADLASSYAASASHCHHKTVLANYLPTRIPAVPASSSIEAAA